MFSLIKQFIVLLSFNSSLETKCLLLNNEPCMVTPTLIDMNPVELRHYSFMISLNKCTGSLMSYLQETKDTYVKAFNMKQTKMKLKQ